MQPSFSKSDFKIIEQRTAFDGFFKIHVYRFKHRLFAGGWSEVYQREIFERGHSACILLFDPKNDTLVLVEQFRIACAESELGPWSLELVAGMVEKGRDPEQTVLAEAMEEAGCEVRDVFFIGSFLASPGGTTERVSMFCGVVDSEDLGGIFGLDEEHEDIKVHVVAREKAFEWLESDKIDNATTIIGLQWLQVNHKKIIKKLA